MSRYAGSGEVLLFRRKDSNENIQKNEIYLCQRLSESNPGVRIRSLGMDIVTMKDEDDER